MASLRSVNTKFWEDTWVEGLNISDKLLFLYLITNSYANLAGIYEITIRRISFETGLNQETIRKGLKGFERVKKAYFVNDNYIFLPNWLRNQNLNGNMKKGVVNIIINLPKDVKISVLGNHYQTIQNDYQTILNTLLKYEEEVLEEEVLEEEVLEEIEKDIFSFDEFWIKYPKKVSKAKCESKFKKLSNAEKKKIKETIDFFLSYKPFESYTHPNPETYLNNKRWDDEIPKNTYKPKQTSMAVSDYSIKRPEDNIF